MKHFLQNRLLLEESVSVPYFEENSNKDIENFAICTSESYNVVFNPAKFIISIFKYDFTLLYDMDMTFMLKEVSQTFSFSHSGLPPTHSKVSEKYFKENSIVLSILKDSILIIEEIRDHIIHDVKFWNIEHSVYYTDTNIQTSVMKTLERFHHDLYFFEVFQPIQRTLGVFVRKIELIDLGKTQVDHIEVVKDIFKNIKFPKCTTCKAGIKFLSHNDGFLVICPFEDKLKLGIFHLFVLFDKNWKFVTQNVGQAIIPLMIPFCTVYQDLLVLVYQKPRNGSFLLDMKVEVKNLTSFETRYSTDLTLDMRKQIQSCVFGHFLIFLTYSGPRAMHIPSGVILQENIARCNILSLNQDSLVYYDEEKERFFRIDSSQTALRRVPRTRGLDVYFGFK